MTTASEAVPLTVVLNTYNRVDELPRAVASVLAQTFTKWQLVIVDDGSSDRTPDYVQTIDDPRVSSIRHPNVGLTASRNAGAAQARGEWVAFLDDDDAVEPDWMERLLERASDRVGIVFCGHRRVSTLRDDLGTFAPVDLGPAFLSRVGSYLPGTWIMRREVFDHAGGYLDGLTFIHQFELLLRAVRSTTSLGLTTTAVSAPLLRYTVREESQRPMQWPQYALDGGRWVLARHRPAFAIDRMRRADHEGVVGVAAARLGQMSLARRHLWRSLRADPTNAPRWARLGASMTRTGARLAWGGVVARPDLARPLPAVHQLPPAHRREEDHLFLPWSYRGNAQASADSEGTPYWADPSKNDPMYQHPVYRFAARQVRARGWRTVIDVGTGTGVKLERFILPVADRVVGLDQESAISLARTRCERITWLSGDLMAEEVWTQLDQECFDLVVCADVIEHVDEPMYLLQRLRDLVGADGRLLISTPDRMRFDRPAWYGPPGNPRHVREWTSDEFELLLESAGLEIVNSRRFFPRGYRFTPFELKRSVWRALHGMPVPDRRSNMAFVCRQRRG